MQSTYCFASTVAATRNRSSSFSARLRAIGQPTTIHRKPPWRRCLLVSTARLAAPILHVWMWGSRTLGGLGLSVPNDAFFLSMPVLSCPFLAFPVFLLPSSFLSCLSFLSFCSFLFFPLSFFFFPSFFLSFFFSFFLSFLSLFLCFFVSFFLSFFQFSVFLPSPSLSPFPLFIFLSLLLSLSVFLVLSYSFFSFSSLFIFPFFEAEWIDS